MDVVGGGRHNQVPFMAKSPQIVSEINKSVSEAIFSNGTNVSGGQADVAPDRSPGLTITSPGRSKVNANLNVGLERGIGSNFRLKQRLRHGRQCRYVNDSCTRVLRGLW